MPDVELSKLLKKIGSSLPNIAYFCGYVVGFVIQLVLEAFLTGGAKAIETMIAKISGFLKSPVAKVTKGLKAAKAVSEDAFKTAIQKLSKFFDDLKTGKAKAALKQWVKEILEAIKKELGISDDMIKDGNYFRRISTGGLRGELELTKEQVVDIIEYAKKYGIKEEDIFIKYNDRDYTSYARLFGAKDVLYINSDVMPAIKATTANSRVSWKGAIAHELEGHRAAALVGKTHPINELEEVQASIRASKFGKDLTEIERNTLWEDAMERLEKYGKNYEQIKNELWLEEF